MRVLIAGCGVIGTVYGAHLGAAGHAVSVLSHPPRTNDVKARGLSARDVLTGNRAESSAVVVPDAAAGCYDLVLVAVRADQLASACAELTELQGAPAVLFFGNNRLAYHAAFVACVTAALYRCGSDPARLAADRHTLTLMGDAVTEAFRALRHSGVAGPPRNLAALHSPALKLVAVRYWARTMRSPSGELFFAAHARHAQPEMRALAIQVTARLGTSPAISRLSELLLAAPPSSP